MIQTVYMISPSCSTTKYLIFDGNDLQMEGNSLKTLQLKILAQTDASRIRLPLAILPGRRVVFLSMDNWICS